MRLGDKIKKLRQKKKLTQKELAKKLYISDKAVSSWEANRTEPSLDLIVSLSDILDCSASYLLYEKINKNNIETEIRIKLTEEEFKELELLMKRESVFLKENHHIDTYYQPIFRKFIKEGVINEWLRIGVRGSKNILNYKNWYDTYCDEYEVEIDDVDNLKKIFTIIGLEEISLVDKTRRTYFYLNKYEVALDVVKDLGYFVEIEVKKYEQEANLEYDALLRVAKNLQLKLENIDSLGYAYYCIKQRDNKI